MKKIIIESFLFSYQKKYSNPKVLLKRSSVNDLLIKKLNFTFLLHFSYFLRFSQIIGLKEQLFSQQELPLAIIKLFLQRQFIHNVKIRSKTQNEHRMNVKIDDNGV